MSKVVLIACAKSKLQHPAAVRDLYQSPLFRLNLRYAESLSPNFVYVLSAKHGLIPLDEKIEPYDVTLNTMTAAQRRAWSARVLQQLSSKHNLDRDQFVILAGMNYRRYLEPHLVSCDVPLAGLGIGQQLQHLKSTLENSDG